MGDSRIVEAFHEPWEHRTSNIQHPTSNTQPPTNGPIGNHWLFDVGCWVLDVFLRFMGSMRDIFGEFSPRSFKASFASSRRLRSAEGNQVHSPADGYCQPGGHLCNWML